MNIIIVFSPFKWSVITVSEINVTTVIDILHNYKNINVYNNNNNSSEYFSP